MLIISFHLQWKLSHNFSAFFGVNVNFILFTRRVSWFAVFKIFPDIGKIPYIWLARLFYWPHFLLSIWIKLDSAVFLKGPICCWQSAFQATQFVLLLYQFSIQGFCVEMELTKNLHRGAFITFFIIFRDYQSMSLPRLKFIKLFFKCNQLLRRYCPFS